MRFSSKSRAACFCCFFSDLLIWLNLYDDQIACQCWCRQSANTWHTKLKSGASNLHGAGASNLQDNNIMSVTILYGVRWNCRLPSLKSVTEFQSVVMIAFRFKSIIAIKNSRSNEPVAKWKTRDLSLALIRFLFLLNNCIVFSFP